VHVTTRSEGGSVVLEVADNGVGIRSEHLPRVFDPFFTTKALGKGTGLGMSISFGIIRDMGGTIEILPAESGARIRVAVPAEESTGGDD
jgi:C4-dicarboxylate-specific signal transduction histidine kinase